MFNLANSLQIKTSDTHLYKKGQKKKKKENFFTDLMRDGYHVEGITTQSGTV